MCELYKGWRGVGGSSGVVSIGVESCVGRRCEAERAKRDNRRDEMTRERGVEKSVMD